MSGEHPEPADRTPLYPLDPQDGRVDTLLMSPAVNPPPRERKPWEPEPTVTPYPADLMECLCGAHIWLSQEGRRYEYGGLPHACEPGSVPDGNLSTLAADIMRQRDEAYWKGLHDEQEKVSPRNLSVSTETAQDAPDAAETVTDTADPLKGL